METNISANTSIICAMTLMMLLFFIRAVATVNSVPSSAPTIVGSAGSRKISTRNSG